ncbi:AAA family ATPase [Candidatus Mycoplasma pogonae]
MKLIKIEAHGFKSFADKVTLSFDGGVVGIVGPNGSGKSNINDAIRWVLGEQSSKALRGDSMEDVIFAGSKSMKPLDKAEVILTFDNSDNAVSIPHKKFTISRVLHRGKGSNEYFINDEPARFRDIKEIAIESGISKSSLAIISQGTISSIAESSAQDRRAIFEEAAGTSKYKSRKIETLRKLQKTDEALEKVSAVVFELEKQVKPLEKQATKAKIFLEKSEQLKNVEIGLLVADLNYYGKIFEALTEELKGVEEAKNDIKNRIENIDLNLKQKINFRGDLEKEISNITLNLEEINKKLQNIAINKSKIAQRREMLISGEIQVTEEEKLAAIKSQLEELHTQIQSISEYEKQTEDKLRIYYQEIEEYKKEISILQSKEYSANTKINHLNSQIMFLKESKESQNNLFKGTKNIVKNANLFKGYKGLVADILEIAPQHHIAIESVLNNTLQNVVVANSETAVEAINFLKRNNGGKATFIPLASIKPKILNENHQLILKNQNGFIGVASDLVKTKPEFIILNKFLLGNILVTDQIENANRIAKLMENRYMITTLEGDIIRAGGVMSGGAKSQANNSFLGIDQKIIAAENQLPELQQAINAIKQELLNLENQKNSKIVLMQELRSTLAATKERKNVTIDAFNNLKIRYQESNKEILNFENINSSLQEESNLEASKNDLEVELRAKREQVNNFNSEIRDYELEKNNLQKTFMEISDSSSKKTSEKDKTEFIVENAFRRLSEHYQLTLENAQENYQLKLSIDEAREIVDTLKKEIEALGNVNLDSIKDYEAVSERYNDLKTSQEELQEAKNVILGAIAEMDKIIVQRLRKTVEEVNEEFKNVFQKMFGGGDAQIFFENPNDILESGIEIFAQPPGKSIKNIKLFSGGEKALIAISLLFSIIKAKPIPLCILDEVEAALDEANVIRYAEFLQLLKPLTQFLVITHRYGTMSLVDHLFGATMQKRGITSFFTVELSKAKELIKQ